MTVTQCGPLPPEEIKRRLVRLTLPAASGKFRLPVLPWEMMPPAMQALMKMAMDAELEELRGKAYGSE